MGKIHVGPKGHRIVSTTALEPDLRNDVISQLQIRVEELETSLKNTPRVETIKEVPVEVIKEVVREVKITRDRFVEVPVEKIVEKEVQVIKNFPVYQEIVIEKFVDRPFEVIKEVMFIPKFLYGIMVVEALLIVVLLIK